MKVENDYMDVPHYLASLLCMVLVGERNTGPTKMRNTVLK